MRFFDVFKADDINQGVKEFRETPGAVLLDVRTPEEYREGHIPGSKNIPLKNIGRVSDVVGNYDTPVFVYCLSGGRSRQAVEHLKRMGYAAVKNIGGISGWKGEKQR